MPLRRALRPPSYSRIFKRLDALERNVENVLTLTHGGEQRDVAPRALLQSREFRVFSQNGEDGLLLHIFSQIGTTSRQFVEFGIQDGRECNCAVLALRFGWSGLFMEFEPEQVAAARHLYHEQHQLSASRVRIEQARVSPENIDALLSGYGMSGEIDLLSIDIDSFDYWVWRSINAIRPRVVVIEYNASLGPSAELVMPYDPQLDIATIDPGGLDYGASLAALAHLGNSRGYALVGCESAGVNAFFVRKELLRGELSELTPEAAWWPHRRRSRRASPSEQQELTARCDFRPPPADAEGPA